MWALSPESDTKYNCMEIKHSRFFPHYHLSRTGGNLDCSVLCVLLIFMKKTSLIVVYLVGYMLKHSNVHNSTHNEPESCVNALARIIIRAESTELAKLGHHRRGLAGCYGGQRTFIVVSGHVMSLAPPSA